MREILVFLEFVCILCAIRARTDVYIDQNKEGECSERDPQRIVCPSMERYMQQYNTTSNVSIHVTGEMIVSSLVKFQNISNLSIIGESKNTTIICMDLSGFQFVTVLSLEISNIVIIGCGADYIFQDYNMTVAVTINSCSDILLANVALKASKQTSLLIQNTAGNNYLRDIHVCDNILVEYSTSRGSFAGGVLIFFDEDTESSSYEIADSTFFNLSTAKYIDYDPNDVDVSDWLGYGLGGGLSITFSNKSSNHKVLLENCLFKDNIAPWGGGIHAKFLHACNNTSITVSKSTFESCKAHYGGGGIVLGFAAHVLSDNYNNQVSILDTKFLENNGTFGAGIYIFSFLGGSKSASSLIYFFNCSWIGNTAVYSPAVDISPSRFDYLNKGLLPIPEFESCRFIGNKIYFKEENNNTLVTAGVFVISRFTVLFRGRFLFENNAYNALLLNSGQVILEQDTEVTFTNNRGFRGGAISLHGFSSILINVNCRVEFYNNSVTEYGGAIFHFTTEQRAFFSTRSCFLEYSGDQQLTVSKRNISFVFSGNTAILGGSSIFTSSLYSCYYSYKGSIIGHQVTDFFDDIGNFTFQTANGTTAPIGTSGHTLKNDMEHTNLVSIPGKYFYVPITLYDELQQKITSEYFIQEDGLDDTVSTRNHFTRNSFIKLYGAENSTGEVFVTTPHNHRILQYRLNVTLLPCPPGYYYDNLTQSCKCSADDKSTAYPGITKCKIEAYMAIIQGGYWAGKYPKTNRLYTAPCPFQFCNFNTTVEKKLRKLPNLSEALDNFFCQSRRQGVLCGQCRAGNSTFYHSKTFRCDTNDNCNYGIIYFILSEIFPVCIFFILVLIFDFSFTTGARNGFIFFSQMVTILEFEHSFDDNFLKTLQAGYNIFYGIFNIDFFSVEPLSFCLFKNATVMDVLAFKYITIVFAFILMTLVVVCMAYCNCCTKLCIAMKRKVNTRASVLHGLSAFIVICYAECVRVSFFILRKTALKGAGNSVGPYMAFYGGYDYLGKDHVMYAIPAIITLGIIAFFPPMLLLIYPSVLKLLGLCKLSEHRLVLGVLRVTRINSLMPMFDVFQSSFKHNFSFFAGLYLIYRAAILAPYSFSSGIFAHTITTALILLVILGIHSAVQPYKEKTHNIVDSLLFLNLATINGLTVLEIQIAHPASNDHNTFLRIVTYVQVLLIYTPIVAVVILRAVWLYKGIRKLTKRQTEIQSDQEFLVHLDSIDRSIEDESDTSNLESSYTQQTETTCSYSN